MRKKSRTGRLRDCDDGPKSGRNRGSTQFRTCDGRREKRSRARVHRDCLTAWEVCKVTHICGANSAAVLVNSASARKRKTQKYYKRDWSRQSDEILGSFCLNQIVTPQAFSDARPESRATRRGLKSFYLLNILTLHVDLLFSNGGSKTWVTKRRAFAGLFIIFVEKPTESRAQGNQPQFWSTKHL